MNSNSKLSYAIAAILSGSSLGVAHAATGADASDSEGIQEITVTAQRRVESIQTVPITIQALTGDQLTKLNVTTFNDLLKYTPNVTFSGNGPGTGNIFMRGLSSGGSGNQSQSTTAPFPNVALYLDDQSMQFPARNNDVYMVDMERIEVLEGPQGTLFGGGSQAGAVRYITNKPKLDVTEGDVNAGYGITARGGDPNANVNATINLPLIADTLALRATIFNDHRGGYINNVPGSISFPGSPVANNSALVATDTNPVDYTGIRLSGLYRINEDWNVLIQQNYQNMRADGYFAEYPEDPTGKALAPYEITAFTPAFNKDKYESTSWTVNGKVSDMLKAVYTGSYLVRHIEQQADYSNYSRSGGGQYYACTGAGAPYFKTAKPTTCYAPVGDWHDAVENNHQSHEIRLSTNEDYRLRGIAGAFWEQFDIRDVMNYNYLQIPQCSPQNLALALAGGVDCVSAVGPLPGYYANDPSLRTGSNTAFGEDVQRGYKQAAAFTSLDFDLIPKVLTLSGGTRYFHYDEYERGSEFYTGTAGVINVPNGACTAAGGCGFGIDLHKKEHGFKSRGNLTWHITPDILAYYTYSQGFRPGGFNRTQEGADGAPVLKSAAPYAGKGTDQFDKPAGFGSDNLVNNEIGVKSEFLNHRIQLNVSAYKMKWSTVQLPLFDPVHLGNTQFVINGPTYEIKGVELQLVARVTEGLTIQGSSSWNSSNQTDAPCLPSNIVSAGNPTPVGQCITQVKGKPYTNPYGVLNTSPAFSPPLQFNLRARYDHTFNDYKPFISVGASHVGSMRDEPASFPPDNSAFCGSSPTTTLCLYTMPGYTTYDATVGVAKDNWTAQVTGNNITNSDASTNTSSGQFIKSEFPLRPRVLTLLIGYRF